MNMNGLAFSDATALLIGLVGLVWLGWLSWALLRTVQHYRKLVEKPGESLETVLNRFHEQQEGQGKAIEALNASLATVQEKMRMHVQHIGFVRFNPFGASGTGGDQSFALSLLDDRKNGIVISSLHSRTGTRFYAKPVVGGRGEGRPLTKEEMRAVQESVGRQQK